jgi:NAD(P)-dependent dehydrogenase (short-subunit alcohol dehydrogenase family)
VNAGVADRDAVPGAPAPNVPSPPGSSAAADGGAADAALAPDPDAVPDYPGRLRLDGRGFVCLGAGQGIGRQATHALAAVGANVFCVDLEADRAERVASEVGGVAWSCDITDRAASASLFAEAETALGAVHGVVDIVGMAQYAPLLDTDDAGWAWHHDIVLRHAWLALQHATPALRRAGGGSFAFVASVSGLTGAPMHAAYGAAKAGLMALVRSAAVELGPSGIRVNAVAPGVVWTPRVSGFLGEPGRRTNAANTPLRRVALPADIAAALLYLSSDLASYVNGHVLVVDGGWMGR